MKKDVVLEIKILKTGSDGITKEVIITLAEFKLLLIQEGLG